MIILSTDCLRTLLFRVTSLSVNSSVTNEDEEASGVFETKQPSEIPQSLYKIVECRDSFTHAEQPNLEREKES